MPLGSRELGCQKRLDDVPGHGRPHGSSAHANDIHVIVLDPLFSRIVVVDQGGSNSGDLVSTYGCTHAAGTDGYAALHATRSNSLGQGDDEVRTVVGGIQLVSAAINHIMSRRAKVSYEFLL
jgi:hypothetical protein